jgi:hypothetical protein
MHISGLKLLESQMVALKLFQVVVNALVLIQCALLLIVLVQNQVSLMPQKQVVGLTIRLSNLLNMASETYNIKNVKLI